MQSFVGVLCLDKKNIEKSNYALDLFEQYLFSSFYTANAWCMFFDTFSTTFYLPIDREFCNWLLFFPWNNKTIACSQDRNHILQYWSIQTCQKEIFNSLCTPPPPLFNWSILIGMFSFQNTLHCYIFHLRTSTHLTKIPRTHL